MFPQKGSFVAPIKLSAVRNNHFIRKALELAVLRRAAEAWTPEVAATIASDPDAAGRSA